MYNISTIRECQIVNIHIIYKLYLCLVIYIYLKYISINNIYIRDFLDNTPDHFKYDKYYPSSLFKFLKLKFHRKYHE